ncbi:hypothetical protein GCM10023206_24620 [Acinetobacter puyangensis]|uniref:Lipoprotein n=1 Tax=Acinetobacter puyangensis TaxID=1096779 RepID=A0A240E7B2_9GAMM|nr:hypothetical protein [Acinetobacter puyangensis]SNX43770.1 hypothetical protein SAMN05421731_101814 [Acinetobacter puyangensis]
MKKSLIYTAFLGALLVMTGCGSSDESSENNSQNSNTGGNSSEQNNEGNQTTDTLTETQRQKILEVSEESGAIVLKESLLGGVIDTLVFGTDEAEADEKCSSGSYVKTAGVITFTNCEGLFKTATGLNQYKDLTASGKVTVTDGNFTYQDLILRDSDSGESKTVNGTVKFSSGSTEQDLIDSLEIKATEKNGSAFIDVTYKLENYKLIYDQKSGSELALTTTGTLTATNSSVGDYKVNITNTQPFFVQIDADDEAISSYPYSGVMQIEDLNNQAVTTITANTDKKTLLYSVKVSEKEIANGTKTWQEVLGFSQ